MNKSKCIYTNIYNSIGNLELLNSDLLVNSETNLRKIKKNVIQFKCGSLISKYLFIICLRVNIANNILRLNEIYLTT